MTISKLATEVWPLGKTASGRNRFYKRAAKPQGFIVHHAATTYDSALKSAFVLRSRELSANYAMRRDGTIVAVLHEEYRPFTSASPRADNWGITIEVVNESGAPGWEISDRAFDQLARLIADCALRWGWTLSRSTVIGHREVLGRFGQGYATACPGGIWPRMDELIELAKRYAGQAGPSSPAPSLSKPKPPASIGAVRLGSQLQLSRWVGYRTSALTGRQGSLLSGTFEVVGISRGNFKVRGGGREAWVHNSAKAGLVVPKPKPAAAEPWRTPVGRTMLLAEARSAYRTALDAARRSPVWKRVPAGSYRITGASRGQFHIEGNGWDVWISDGARSGVR